MPARKKQTRDFRKNAERISFMRRHRTAFRRAGYGFCGFFLLAVFFSGYMLVKLGYIGKAEVEAAEKLEKIEYQISSALGLNLRNVYLEGQKYTTVKEIMQAADFKKNQPIFLLDLAAMKKRLESLDWVEKADIERTLPGSLHINIVEKKPLAIWQNKGQMALIDEKGETISKKHIEEFPYLPLVVGEDAGADAKKIFTALAEAPELESKVAAIIRVGGRRWNLRLKNNIEVLLPEDENMAASLQYLADLDKKKQLLERRIKSVDLRLPDRIFIKEADYGLRITDDEKKNSGYPSSVIRHPSSPL